MTVAGQVARATTTEGPTDGRPMTLADLADLPPTLDGHQVAKIWGCSYWCLLEMRKAGTCPVAPLSLGRHLRWPTVSVLEAIGVTGEVSTSPEPVRPIVQLRNVRRRAT